MIEVLSGPLFLEQLPRQCLLRKIHLVVVGLGHGAWKLHITVELRDPCSVVFPLSPVDEFGNMRFEAREMDGVLGFGSYFLSLLETSCAGCAVAANSLGLAVETDSTD